jgi:C1A family cysteine protease
MFRKKGVLLGICFIFLFSGVFLYGNEAELQRLRAQGQKEGWTFTVGKTSVSDIPLEKLCGLKIPKNWQQMAPYEEDVFARQTRQTPPATFDWRDYNKVTPVKNQGSCGACWAFGMLGSYEGIQAVDGQGLQDLSEQFLVRCNSHGYGCNGGWWCYDDMCNGIPLESCYPYTGTDGSCSHSCTLYFPVDNWYYVGSSSSVPSTSALKQAIYDHGPVCAAVYVDSAFQNYTGGIFNSCQSRAPNHAIVLVGWNDSGGYWILKNSWGTGWGESGYMRITYGCSNVGYAAAYAIPKIGPLDSYEHNNFYSCAYGPIDTCVDYDNAEISTSSDEDWFHFTIEDTGTITVSVNHETGEDLNWYLYHESDEVNWVASGCTENDPEVGDYEEAQTGKYYVRVVGYNGSTSTYTLNVTYPEVTYYRFMNRFNWNAMGIITANYVGYYTYNCTDDQHWEIIDLENGYYRIDNKSNGNSLEGGIGYFVYLEPWDGNTDQQWEIIDLGNGYYRIDNRYMGYSLALGSSNYVIHYPWNEYETQQWQIISENCD